MRPSKTGLLFLVVEDNKDVANYLGMLFKNKYDVHYAENGKIGLEKAIQLIPDIVVSDIMMPIDGWL